MDQVFATAQEPIRYGHITSETLIPPSRGLGSSSTAMRGVSTGERIGKASTFKRRVTSYSKSYGRSSR